MDYFPVPVKNVATRPAKEYNQDHLLFGVVRMETPFYIPESAMAIVAHPDDIEYSCSGTLARWALAGAKTYYILCTSGDVGVATAGMTKARAAEIREQESR